MFRSLAARVAVILGIVALCTWTLYDHHLETGSPVRLGLDLRGGMHLVLEVDDPEGAFSPEARADAIERSRRIIRHRVDALGVAEPIIQVVGEERLIVELAGIHDEARAREVIGRTAMLEWRLVHPWSSVDDALALIQARVHVAGAADELWVADGDVDRVRAELATERVRRAIPRGIELRWGPPAQVGVEGSYRALYAVGAEPLLTGDMLDDARAGRDPETGRPLVRFELSRAGGRRFAEVTGRHIGDRLAILLDGEVVSAPEVISRIGASGVIQMDHASMREAHDLALVLRAGALPAPLRIMEERSVGPSLGRDSIEQGWRAGVVGLVLVVAVMIGYYRTAGLLAVSALGVYVLVLLAALAAIGRELTLPGIAGIVLSIGMAVDANVLIFERIREEMAEGRSGRRAVEAGFAHALSAIVDANVTTLLTAFVLFRVGSGPVQGFAATLSIGILASFFTALYVTRTFFLLRFRRTTRDREIRI